MLRHIFIATRVCAGIFSELFLPYNGSKNSIFNRKSHLNLVKLKFSINLTVFVDYIT